MAFTTVAAHDAQPEVVGIDSRPLKIYLHNKRSLFQSGGTRVRSNVDQMGGSRLACARYTQDPNERGIGSIDASGSAGVLSRGVGLRGFESHPPHQQRSSGLRKPGHPIAFVDSSSGRFFQGLRFFAVANPSLLE